MFDETAKKKTQNAESLNWSYAIYKYNFINAIIF